jgi:sugar phosphate isomerase/epimerase
LYHPEGGIEMKIGLSTYSLSKAIESGEMDVLQVLQWIADNGGEHVEIVPAGFSLSDNGKLVSALVKKAGELNLDISSYTIGAGFIDKNDKEFEEESERVKREVDIAKALGVRFMRHDAAFRPADNASLSQFEKDLPIMAEACRRIADYAGTYGITTSVENHGFHVQASERVLRLLNAVDRKNFKTTLDIGNFICADEDPLSAVKRNIPFASMVHVKDFYLRPASADPGEGWHLTAGGRYRRGAIAGHGDIGVEALIKVVKDSGYDGYISIEFEGMEDCRIGSRIGMENTRRYWER